MSDGGDILRRVPPQNIEAEESVLGAILLDNDAINPVIEFCEVGDFYRESHRLIFQAMLDLADRNEPIDATMLVDNLRGKGVLEQIGGPVYIAELAIRVPTASNAAYYAGIVHKKAVLRALASAHTELASEAYDATDPDECIDQAEHKIFQLSERRTRPSFITAADLMRSTVKLVERLYENRELVTGVPTGFTDIDRITAGLQPSDLIIVAARPSMGKTALALNIVAHAAMDAGLGVVFFSLEMSKEQLGLRLLCSEARIDSAKARAGFLKADDFPKIARAAARVSAARIFIDDSSLTSPVQLSAKARRLARDPQNKLGLIVVDYLQLMRAARPAESREKEIAEISRSLKALAKELKIPVLALSQLNRQVETRPDRRPLLADLRESGAIEQDADVIAFIYRDELYHKDSEAAGTAEVIIAKQRNGPTDTAILTYLKQFTRFENFDQHVESYLGGQETNGPAKPHPRPAPTPAPADAPAAAVAAHQGPGADRAPARSSNTPEEGKGKKIFGASDESPKSPRTTTNGTPPTRPNSVTEDDEIDRLARQDEDKFIVDESAGQKDFFRK